MGYPTFVVSKTGRRKKHLVLGVTGSIACYKAAELARFFMRKGFEVRVVMTRSATKFVSPLTFQALTGNPVAESFWDESTPGNIGHIELADWADVVVIAPATADCIAKMAFGFAESSLLAVVLATKAPVVIAPAMNVNMLEHPRTQANLELLRNRGVTIVEPEAGALACGWVGSGRLAAVAEIHAQTDRVLGPGDLAGKRVVISAGPTREAVDPVRYLSNRSSGKMGVALAREAYRRGAQVTLAHGPLGYKPVLASGIVCRQTTTAHEMHEAVVREVFGREQSEQADIVIMAAAVADFRPAHPGKSKIKKSVAPAAIELSPNIDILRDLGERRGEKPRPYLVGFAVETEGEAALIREAQSKAARKKVDLIVGNLASDAFEGNTNRCWIVDASGGSIAVDTASKRSIACSIWAEIVARL